MTTTDWAYDFSDGLACVGLADGVFGYINKNGEYIINPQFEYASWFSEGLASVGIGDKYGYINKKGEIAINPQYEGASDFYEGLAAVKIGEKWGFINKKGQIAIEPKYNFQPSGFRNGLAKVVFQKNICNESLGIKYYEVTWGYIDKSGNMVYNNMKEREYII